MEQKQPQQQRQVTFGHIKNLEREIELLKEQLKELKADNKEEVSKINKRISDLEDKHTEMMLLQTEMKQDIRHVNETLKTLVSEVKTIGEEIIRIKTTEQIEQDENTNTIFTSFGKGHLIVIATICAIALMAMGAKMGDILSLLAM